MIKYKNACHPTNSKRAIPFSLALRLRWVCSTVQRSYFTKKCYHHHYRRISMRSIHTNMQTSTPLHLIHHSQQTHEHFNLIPSFPHHIHVCTYCCLSTQQPLQLFVRAQLRNPSKNNAPPEVLFNVAVIVVHALTYPTDLLLTHSAPQAKPNPNPNPKEPLLTTLPATQKS